MPYVCYSRLAPVVIVAQLSSTVGLFAADWPTFRGPNRTAVSNDKGLLQKWPDGGPRLLWKADGVGRGYASVAIADGRIFTLGDGVSAGDPDEYLLCFDKRTGEQIWKTRTGPPWAQGQPTWQSSRSTPTVDGDLVYALTADGLLMCCDAKTGEKRWQKRLTNDFGGKKADNWGYSESVLVDGEHVVCTPGGDRETMVALDKRTGTLKWKTIRAGDRGAGHASIVAAEIGGTRVYVQSTGSGPLGVRATDGKLLWSYPIDKTTAVIPTPIVRGDLVFFDAGYKRGGALLKQSLDADGGVKIEQIYSLKPDLANKHGGVVLVGDYIYGDSEDSGIPFCAELATGKIMWKKRLGHGSAAIAAADNCLYIHSADGTVLLAKATSDDYTEVGRFKAPGSGERPSWSHPVIDEGKLYIREHQILLCYDVQNHIFGGSE
jgi:outer membrane protein assembly factor BamB